MGRKRIDHSGEIRCSKCKTWKNSNKFTENKKNKTGRMTICIDCVSRIKNPLAYGLTQDIIAAHKAGMSYGIWKGLERLKCQNIMQAK